MRISIIVPTLQEEHSLADTLEALPSRADVEVIVADGGSWDRTMEIAKQQGVTALQISGGRSCQLNAAAALSGGDILLFLHADTRLPDSFVEIVVRTLQEEGVVAGAFRLRIDGDGWGFRLIEAVANWRSRFLQTPYGDQALFVSRKAFEAAGRFPELPIMEDFALIQRLRKLGRVRLAEESALTSARRWKRLGLLRTTLINWGMVCGYYAGIPPARLASWYRGNGTPQKVT